MNNVITLNKSIEDKRFTNAKGLQQIFIGLGRSTIDDWAKNGIITFIKAMLNYAVDNEFLSQNPILRLKTLPQVKPTIHFLNEKQIEGFLQQVETCPQTYKAFFYTAIYTGMRRGELLALEWSDIDFKQNKIRVNKQIYRGITQTTKTSKERFIDMPESLKDVLVEHKKQGILSKYVFHHNGKPLHPWNMEETYFKPLLKRCNEILDEENQIEKLRFHDLRHSYATYLLSKGIPVKYVQKQLGHSKATMTLDTYADVMPSVKFGALDLLNKMKNNEQIEHKLSTKN